MITHVFTCVKRDNILLYFVCAYYRAISTLRIFPKPTPVKIRMESEPGGFSDDRGRKSRDLGPWRASLVRKSDSG